MQVVRAKQAPNVSAQQIDSEIQIHCFLKCSNVWCDLRLHPEGQTVDSSLNFASGNEASIPAIPIFHRKPEMLTTFSVSTLSETRTIDDF